MAYVKSISLKDELWERLNRYLLDHPDTNFKAVAKSTLDRFLTEEGYPCVSDATSLTTP